MKIIMTIKKILLFITLLFLIEEKIECIKKTPSFGVINPNKFNTDSPQILDQVTKIKVCSATDYNPTSIKRITFMNGLDELKFA